MERLKIIPLHGFAIKTNIMGTLPPVESNIQLNESRCFAIFGKRGKSGATTRQQQNETISLSTRLVCLDCGVYHYASWVRKLYFGNIIYVHRTRLYIILYIFYSSCVHFKIAHIRKCHFRRNGLRILFKTDKLPYRNKAIEENN